MPVLPFVMVDGNGATVARAVNCRIKKIPDLSRGKDVSSVEWVIMAGNMEYFLGGMPGLTYDPVLFSASFGGVPIQGFADGEVIKIVMNEDLWKNYCGTDGEVAWSRQKDKRALISFFIKITSATNDALSALAKIDSIPLPV